MKGLLKTLHDHQLLTNEYVEHVREEEEERRRRAEEVGEAVVDEVIHEGLPHITVLKLCSRRALVGSLSVELDVRPDELVGPLTATIGASARKMRVMDVRDGPPLRMTIFFEDHEETWELEDLYPLVLNVNDLVKEDRKTRAMAILGEWEDCLQLWSVEKEKLPWLLQQPFFAPRNRHQLIAMIR